MNETYYRQCRLARGQSHQVAWIPERYATKGSCVCLKQEDDSWEDSWIVTSAGDSRLEGSILNDRSQDYKRTRKASDV